MVVSRALTVLVTCTILSTVRSAYSPTGCTFQQGNGRATCDFTGWDPPLDEVSFGPGAIYKFKIENVDGTIPSEAFSGIDCCRNTTGTTAEIEFECNLENVILSANVFTPNLDWIERLEFRSCYVQDGIASYSLSNMTSLREFVVDGGIIGPLTSASFAGLDNLEKIVIQADFLDSDIPTGLFAGLTSLQLIDLRSSGISSIAADTFTGLELLETVDLSGNLLTTLPEGLFSSLRSLTTVDLGTNNWNCTCDMAWLATWSIYTGVPVDVVCSNPTDYAGIDLGRAMATMGCITVANSNTVAQTATGTATGTAADTSGSGSTSSDTGSTEDSTARFLSYIAIALAAVACLVALVMGVAMVTMYQNMKKVASGKNPWRKTVNRVNPYDKMETKSRPPSYRSSERMFINTPVQGRRDVNQPFVDVNYLKHTSHM